MFVSFNSNMTGVTCGAGMLIIPEHNEFNPGFNHDFVDHYGISVPQMTTDMFQLSYSLPGPFLINDLLPGL